jgi:hypothetical protein
MHYRVLVVALAYALSAAAQSLAWVSTPPRR